MKQRAPMNRTLTLRRIQGHEEGIFRESNAKVGSGGLPEEMVIAGKPAGAIEQRYDHVHP